MNDYNWSNSLINSLILIVNFLNFSFSFLFLTEHAKEIKLEELSYAWLAPQWRSPQEQGEEAPS